MEWEKLEISLRKLEILISREHFMQDGYNKGKKDVRS